MENENVLQNTRQCITIIISVIHLEVIRMKDTTVSARVEEDVKTEAEEILQKLGIPVSVVINSLYRQIIYTRGVPFSLSLPRELKAADDYSHAELDAKLEHSYKQAMRGEGRPADEVFADLERSLSY